MIAIEIVGAPNGVSTKTFYFSNTGFCSSPTDTPANTAFVDRIADCGRIGINAYSDGRTGGGTKLEIGATTIVNNDGAYDDLLNYSFDGREIVIRAGQDDSKPYPTYFPVVLRGTMEALQADFNTLTFQLRDKQYMLQKPLLTTTYAGTNTLPNGAEGTAADIKGRLKPLVLGKVFNIGPVLVNTSKLTYQVSLIAVNSIDAVYDRGAAITKGADYADLAALEAASPAASSYITCNALGLFRLGTSPSGTVTSDVTQGANAAARTVAQLLKQLAILGGVSAGSISTTDVANLDAANAAEAGIFVTDSSTVAAVMDKVAASITGWYSFDSAGTLRMGRLSAPTGTPVAILNDYDIYKQSLQRRTPKDNGVPIYKVNLTYARNYTVQSTDLAGSVAAARRAVLIQDDLTVTATDTSVQSQWQLAGVMDVDTQLVSAADAQAEANRLLSLHKVRREVYDVPVDLQTWIKYNIQLMDLVQVNLPRFGMSAGRLFRLIGYRIELGKNRVILVVWG